MRRLLLPLGLVVSIVVGVTGADARPLTSGPTTVGAGSVIIVDGTESHGQEIECLVATGGAVWCSLSRLGQAEPVRRTCGVMADDREAAIFCRPAKSTKLRPLIRKPEPALRGAPWAPAKTHHLLNLLTPGRVFRIADSHLLCTSTRPWRVICAVPRNRVINPRQRLWDIGMSRTQVLLAFEQNGRTSPRGILYPIHHG